MKNYTVEHVQHEFSGLKSYLHTIGTVIIRKFPPFQYRFFQQIIIIIPLGIRVSKDHQQVEFHKKLTLTLKMHNSLQ